METEEPPQRRAVPAALSGGRDGGLSWHFRRGRCRGCGRNGLAFRFGAHSRQRLPNCAAWGPHSVPLVAPIWATSRDGNPTSGAGQRRCSAPMHKEFLEVRAWRAGSPARLGVAQRALKCVRSAAPVSPLVEKPSACAETAQRLRRLQQVIQTAPSACTPRRHRPGGLDHPGHRHAELIAAKRFSAWRQACPAVFASSGLSIASGRAPPD